MKVKDVQYRASDGTKLIGSLYDSETETNSFSVVGFTGFSCKGGDYAVLGHQFANHGVPAIIWEWPGHGRSGGIFDPPMTRKYALEVAKAVKKRTGKPIVLVGHSLGAYGVIGAIGQDEERVADAGVG